MSNRWNYCGDVNLECGGFFWRETDDIESVECIDIIPCSDAGGPDNKFVIEFGYINTFENLSKLESALNVIGMNIENASRFDIIYAFKAYSGIDSHSHVCVQIGKNEDDNPNGWNPVADHVLRSNAKLKNFVRREFL